MKFALGISQLPVPSIVRIAVQRIPPACVPADLDKVRTRKRENPLTNIVGDRTPTLKNPLAGQYHL